jgi:hypothetical protein
VRLDDLHGPAWRGHANLRSYSGKQGHAVDVVRHAGAEGEEVREGANNLVEFLEGLVGGCGQREQGVVLDQDATKGPVVLHHWVQRDREVVVST